MKDLAIVLGIRPDVIRASKILKLLNNQNEVEYDFIWSGQHYSDNMKDTFFRQLNVPIPNLPSSANIISPPLESIKCAIG